MKRVELLAPAKNLEIAIAAINSGADAIYIGASDFGARYNASNTLKDIELLVNYAHKFYVRVHVTINTILNNSELIKAVELVKNLSDIGVDAIIIQDMGLLKLAIDKKIPNIQIHMSTQCDNRTLDKAKFFNDIGVSRVILARELSLEQISNICKNVSCEIETFIHGALCVSYSGQCYMSYVNGGRSANRGECAQPCRKLYSLIDQDDNIILSKQYLLSLKDFNASKYIKNLIDSGAKSFKIEGRLKDISYVKNVVSFYNTEINKFADRTSSGKIFSGFEPNVYKTFNRGYTDYFLNKRKQCYNFSTPKSIGECVGKVIKVTKNYIVVDSILSPQDGICYFLNGKAYGFLVNKVDGNRIYPNKMPNINVGTEIYRNFDSKFENILKNSKTVRKIGVNFIINDNNVVAEDEDFNRVSIDFPSGEEIKNYENYLSTFNNQMSKLGNSDYYLDKIIFNSKLTHFYSVSTINDLRRKLLNKLTIERLNNYPKLVQKPMQYSDFYLSSLDYHANVLNDTAKDFYKCCNCKVCEDALESKPLVPTGVELMRTKHCLKYAANLCGKNTKQLYLMDDNGKKYPLNFECDKCEMVVLNP